MIISDDYNFIFIHIPRTAGTSIEKSLCKAMEIEDWRSFIGEPKELVLKSEEGENNSLYQNDYRKKYEGQKHIKARDLKEEVGKKKWKSYFKFTFVRNPWDRALSMYLKKRKEASKFAKLFWPNGKIFFNLALGIKYQLMKRDSSQQIDFVTDENGEIILDFIGKFENLEEDFYYVCNKLGLEAKLGGHHDSTQHPNYSNFYAKLGKEIIKEEKSEDIERFDYCF